LIETCIIGKRQDDNVGNHWRVHDKIYDLESFVSKHPGGPEWIELTRGSDITEAFETAHVVNVRGVEGMLEKFFIRNATHPRFSPYTFKDDGFYKTLKRRVEPILKVRV
jgi:cytochrome b involved in lipid metabolism